MVMTEKSRARLRPDADAAARESIFSREDSGSSTQKVTTPTLK